VECQFNFIGEVNVKNKSVIFFFFCLLFFKSSYISCVDIPLIKTVKYTGKITKYATAAISVVCVYAALRDTIKSAKLVFPVGQNFKFSSLVKFPFNVLIRLPIGAFKAMKNYFMAFGFGVSAYVLHRLGF